MINKIINTGLTLSLKSLLRFYPAPEPLVFQGTGSMEDLITHMKRMDLESVLLITTHSFVKNRRIDSVLKAFANARIRVEIFTGVPPNPSLDDVEKGSALCREKHCGAIYAMGGGSVIDAAKAMAAQVGNHVPAKKLMGLFKVRRKALPLYVVPTTSGSGSEVTNAAVISDPVTHQKGFLFDHKVVPLAIALDPIASRSLPPSMTAATGMDALTHAIESYVSKISDEKAERMAISAISTIFEILPNVYTDGHDLSAREKMAVASYEAGIAFTRSGLGFVHAISHQLTAFYQIPHGVANAVILPHVLQISKPKITPALARLARVIGVGAADQDDDSLADMFIAAIEGLSAKLGLPNGFPEIREADMERIATNAIKEATFNFPVPMMLKPSDCKAILLRLKKNKACLDNGGPLMAGKTLIPELQTS